MKTHFSLSKKGRLRYLGGASASVAIATLLFGCATNDPLKASIEALNADEILALEFSGTGRWYQFGQAPAPGKAWPAFELSRYIASFDYQAPAARVQITRKQIVEPNRERPTPVEQKLEQLINGDVAWNLAPPQGQPPTTPPVAQPQPATVQERQSEIWATPQGFLRAAEQQKAVLKKTDTGTQVSFTINNIKYEGHINQSHQVENVKAWIDNPILGDTLVEYQYSHYKDFNGVSFPEKIVRYQAGYPVLELNIASASAPASASVDIPKPIIDAGKPPVVVTPDVVAPGVFYLRGGTHHSVAIEQQDHVVLIEAPLNEARSNALIDKIKEIIPNKPIRFVINTHQHFDHSGGLRTFADEGATIVTHELNKKFYDTAWSFPRGISPDRLAKSNKKPVIEAFSDSYTLNGGTHTVEVHTLKGNGHNDAFAFVYLPEAKILVEADAYTPLPAGAPPPASINPFSVNLYDNIKRLNLDVQHIAALHGPGLVTLADLEKFIGK